jgi:hypothetical protein
MFAKEMKLAVKKLPSRRTNKPYSIPKEEEE